MEEEDKISTIKKEVTFLKCQRCGWEWLPKYPDRVPCHCANTKCRSPSWMLPKGQRKKHIWQSEETKARAARKPKVRNV